MGENQRKETVETSNTISKLAEQKAYIEKKAKQTEKRAIEAAKNIDKVNNELINILKKKDFGEKLYDEAREEIVKDREEIANLRMQVLEDMESLEVDFQQQKVSRCEFLSEEYLDDYTA